MWLIIGFIIGILVLGSAWLAKNKNISFKWYELAIGVIGLGLLLFTIQNFLGSFIEYEPQAGYTFLLITGLPSLILLALAWQLSMRRTRKA
ncbi:MULTISPECIES: hypothetical protein [Dehalococcoides]|uniref:hypothetical protein n=1 Tax=Dehalococcoides TaxID=61434 RepID=UPI0002B76FAA|nr:MULTISPECIES: hypothetical protein [Dehalococcoides]AGG05748.1 putative reductive dehalogenase anchoring protein [Dehalococcoides mccartyi DCMB5]BEL00219.1 hypothetical protein DMOBY_00720 [Dehalococcoides mccartyi]